MYRPGFNYGEPNSVQNLERVEQRATMPTQSAQPEERSFIASDLQKLVDKAAQNNAAPTIPMAELPIASEEDKRWLQSEIVRRLKASDELDLSLSFEERGRFYKYRQALRELPMTLGERWSPASVVWPVWART